MERRRKKTGPEQRGDAKRFRPIKAGHVVVVVVRDSTSHNSGRKSHSVDHPSESRSSQPGQQASGPRGMEGRLSRKPNGHVAKCHTRSHGEVTKRCAELVFEVDVAQCAERGGAEPLGGRPGDQVACGVVHQKTPEV